MKIVIATLLLVGLASAVPQPETQDKPFKLAKVLQAMAKNQAENEALSKVREAVKALSHPQLVAKIQDGKEAIKALNLRQEELKIICDLPIIGFIC